MDLRNELIKIIKPYVNESASLLETPPDQNLGDYALPCFQLAKVFKKAPNLIAEELSKQIKPKGILLKVQNVGPYVNFFLDKKEMSEQILSEIYSLKQKYGDSKQGKSKTVVIEYSSPNIAKPFGIAHMRSTMIGNALNGIYQSQGYKVVSLNHLGDWGVQFGKLIVAYKKYANQKELKADPIGHLVDIYIRFHEEAQKNPKLEEEARVWFTRLEAGNKEALKLWKKFRELSLKEFMRMYKLLNVKFDSYAGEASYTNKLGSVMKLLDSKKLTELSEGAIVVKLDEYNMPPCIVKKSDDASIYATRDIAAAIGRAKKYKFEKMLYVVDTRQSLHFAQFFKVLELANFPWAKTLTHVPFGTMTLKGEAMSTREGTFIKLEDVLKKAELRVKEIITKKNPDLTNKDKVALQVALGAIIFWDLSHDRIRDIDFEWDRVLDFEGETGPYVQYTYARSCSILRKAKKEPSTKVKFSLLDKPEEHNLITQLSNLNLVIEDSLIHNKPSILAKYCITLAQSFNNFYQHHTVLSEEKDLTESRLLLVYCTSEVLAKCLALLGIPTPTEM